MTSAFTQPLTVAISLLAVFGLLSHDTQLDSAIVTAVSKLSGVARIDAESVKMKLPEQHIHADSNSFTSGTLSLRAQQPASQAKTENEKKYIAQRRLSGSNGVSEYHWPSI